VEPTIEQGLKIDPNNKELNELKTRIKATNEADLKVVVDSNERLKISNLMAWMKENGGTLNKCKIRWFGPEYRGVVADRDIKKDEVVMILPRKLVLSKEKAAKSVLCKKMTKKLLESQLDSIDAGATSDGRIHMLQAFIAVYLLEEQQKPDSFWRPYIDTLPTDFSSFPAFFTPEEISMCAGS